jgi:hypothetical protein
MTGYADTDISAAQGANVMTARFLLFQNWMTMMPEVRNVSGPQNLRAILSAIYAAFGLGALAGMAMSILASTAIPDSRGAGEWDITSTTGYELQFLRQLSPTQQTVWTATRGHYMQLLNEGVSGAPDQLDAYLGCAVTDSQGHPVRPDFGTSPVHGSRDGVVHVDIRCRTDGPSMFADHYEPPLMRVAIGLSEPGHALDPKIGWLELDIDHHIGSVGDRGSLYEVSCSAKVCHKEAMPALVLMGGSHYNPFHYGQTLDTDDPAAGGMSTMAQILLQESTLSSILAQGDAARR